MRKPFDKIQLPSWYDQLAKDPGSIIDVTQHLEYAIPCVRREHCHLPDKDALEYNVQVVLKAWTSLMFVGMKKDPVLRSAFDGFFTKLLELLLAMKNSPVEEYRQQAQLYLYQGKLYRYLGYTDPQNDGTPIKPEFDGRFVSWGKDAYMPNVVNKLYTPVTMLTCETGQAYGIDLEPFGVCRPGEREVVFQSIQNCIIDVQF